MKTKHCYSIHKALTIAGLFFSILAANAQDEASIHADIIKAYRPLYQERLMYADWVIGDAASDDSDHGGENQTDQPDFQNISILKASGTNSVLDKYWYTSYACISKLNLILQQIAKASYTTKNIQEAQCRFLRAYMYFNLVKVFGDVPLYKEAPVTSYDDSVFLSTTNLVFSNYHRRMKFDQARNTKAEIYLFIENELTSAITILPDRNNMPANDSLHITKGCAQALLTKTYIFQNNWAEAKRISDEIIKSELYSLLPDYHNLFGIKNENNAESVFEIQVFPSANYGESSLRSIDEGLRSYYESAISKKQYGYGMNCPTDEYVKSFTAGDPRLDMVAKPGDSVNVKGAWYKINVYNPDPRLRSNTSPTGYWNRKTEQGDSIVPSQFSGSLNIPIIRYADILLWNAEARLNLGQQDTALKYVNAIRLRARSSMRQADGKGGYLTTISDVPADLQNVSLLDIYSERRHELGLEGHRYYDLVRWGMATDVLRQGSIDCYNRAYSFVTGINEVWPIPDIASASGNYVLNQSAGYKTITVVSPATDTTFKLGTPSLTVPFLRHFSYDGSDLVSYSATSSDPLIATGTISGDSYGIIAHGAGKAVITVTARSESGSRASISFTATISPNDQPTDECSSMAVAGAVSHVKCYGDSNGSIHVSVTGGTAPYTYTWNNTRSDSFLLSMPSGSYQVTVTDSHFCTQIKSFYIAQTNINTGVSLNNPTCNLSNGRISLTTSGGAEPYTYLWNNGSTANYIRGAKSGTYSVTVTDNNGCSKTNTIALDDNGAPFTTIDSVAPSDCSPNNGKIWASIYGGTGELSYLWSDGETTLNRNELAYGTFSLTVTDALGCKSSTEALVPQRPFAQPEISLVTVDSISNNNLVVWNKENDRFIKYYSIYREEDKSGIYKKIADVNFTEKSIYKDTQVNAGLQSWRYQISATGYCGVESAMSPAKTEYKTIHLNAYIISNTVSLLRWDSYEGLNFSAYTIYRKTHDAPLQEIGRVPANSTSWTDDTYSDNVAFYYVAVDLCDVVDPLDILKNESGPFSQSMSNLSEAVIYSSDAKPAPTNGGIVFPNPATSLISLKNEPGTTVTITNISGSIFQSLTLITAQTQIDCKAWPRGLYLIKMKYQDFTTCEIISLQ